MSRASGMTPGEEEAREKSKELDKIVEVPNEQPVALTRHFQRLRTDWNGPEASTMRSVQSILDQRIYDLFVDAYGIEYEILDRVRQKRINRNTGEIEVDASGLPVWETRPDGSYIEDWSLINSKDREAWLYQIITRLFTWEQLAANAWGEALFAKAVWEEAFATGFDTVSDGKGTDKAKDAKATKVAADHRFLAVYKAVFSKKADAICRSMERLAQRLKDLHV